MKHSTDPSLYPLFRNKAGRLTPYALACGYIEEFDTCPESPREGQTVKMWYESGLNPYHVRAHDFTTGKRLLWDCFATLTEARARFDRAKRNLSKGVAP